LRLLRLAPRARRRLLDSAGRFVAGRAALRDQHRRISAARVLAAGVHESYATIVGLFEDPTTPARAEARFSICVALGMYVDGSRTSGTYLPLLEPLAAFLYRSREDVEFDVFSAGCLLGSDWPLRESLPHLLDLSTNARYAVGREEAVHGLGHALPRLKGRRRAEVRSKLRGLARSGRGRGVRTRARMALEGVGY